MSNGKSITAKLKSYSVPKKTFEELSRSQREDPRTNLVESKVMAYDGDEFATIFANIQMSAQNQPRDSVSEPQTEVSEPQTEDSEKKNCRSVDALYERSAERMLFIEFKNIRVGHVCIDKDDTNKAANPYFKFDRPDFRKPNQKDFQDWVRTKIKDTLLMMKMLDFPKLARPNETVTVYLVVKGQPNGLDRASVKAQKVPVLNAITGVLVSEAYVISEKFFDSQVAEYLQ